MMKAKRMMQENIKLIDLIIELVDARAPMSSRNPDIDELGQGKSRLILLNKADLADEKENQAWMAWFQEKGCFAACLDARKRSDMKQINGIIQSACREKMERCAKTGNKPGVTKGKQWIRLNPQVELLDTPGILWPKFEDPQVGVKLAALGSIRDELLLGEELACWLLEYLKAHYPEAAGKRYQTECKGKGEEALTQIAGIRGCVLKGGEPDLRRAASMILEDFRSGRLGRITLESPETRESGEQNG